MKIDLGGYRYCERDELEEIGNIKNNNAVYKGRAYKVNGTLFRTEKGNYVFYGRVYDKKGLCDWCCGWRLVGQADHKFFLSLCDTVINNPNKWEILGYEKV